MEDLNVGLENVNIGRKVIFTINYKVQEEKSNEELKQVLENNEDILYAVFQKEQGENGTIHHQGFMMFEKTMRLARVINIIKIPLGIHPHIDKARGKLQANYEYCTGQGLHSYKRTNIEHTQVGGIVLGDFVEIGIKPIEQQGKRNDIDLFANMIKQGSTLNDLDDFATENNMLSSYVRNKKILESYFLQQQQKKYRNTFRNVICRYLSGLTGVGKSRYIYERYGYDNVFVVDSYDNSAFDDYSGQDVLVLDEFDNSFDIRKMLRLLDGHPYSLRSRNNNRYACFRQVYITTNTPFGLQFANEKERNIRTYEAWLRRFEKGCIGNLEKIKEFDKQLDEKLDDEELPF